MPDPIPCPKCGRLYVWTGARCLNKYCRFGSTEKPLPPRVEVMPVIPASFSIRWQSTSAMDTTAISQLLTSLKPTKYGWRAPLPNELANFFGVPVAIEFETRSLPESSWPPEVTEGEKALDQSIFLQLRDVLQKAEREFESSNAERDPYAMGRVSDPHIWILRDEAGVAQPTLWTFVVGAKDAPDFGWHIEFDGIECRGIWAGD